MEDQERRAPQASRAPLETIVEICGNDSTVPPFEAETVDVSGRGMHVRTAYLPALGAPIVSRFHHEGQEVLVEGVVSWRVEHARGGDFGVQFTAIDKASVEVLRGLCDPEQSAPSSEPEQLVGLGRRVRLHIEGLNAPMKALVRDGTSRKVTVGSNLEFLRVGRRLELEDQQERGNRRAAAIDGVDVVIEPQTGVPQLMVTLRFDDGERTPGPSIVDLDADAATAAESPANPHPTKPGAEAAAFEKEVEAEGDKLQRRLTGQLAALASHAGNALESSGGWLGGLGQEVAGGAGRFARQTASVIRGFRKGRGQGSKTARRVTAPPPKGGFGQRSPRGTEGLRAQHPSGAGRAASAKSTRSTPTSPQKPGNNSRFGRQSAEPDRSHARRGRRLAALIGGAGALGLLTVLALRAASGEPARPIDRAPLPALQKVAAAPAVPITPGAKLQAKATAPTQTEDGIIAKVPLFGDTRMAATEKVSLGPAPGDEGQDDDSDEQDALPSAPDQSWEKKTGAATEPSEIKPWGRGRLHLPTRHELVLNAPGGGLEGKVEPTGFSVFVPDRKVVGDVLAITRRDPRIVKVTKDNGADGTRVTFQFREAVPAYKVRLREKNLEFFISAPD